MTRFMIASLVFAATGCITNGSTGPDQDPNPDPTPDPAPSGDVIPRTGQWYYAEVTPVSSTCSYDVGGEAGSFAIDSASAAGFRIIPGDGTDPFACSLAGSAFDCPDRASLTEDLRPGLDAVLTVHATAAGTFSLATRGSGNQAATVSCAGTGCSALGQWPCNVRVNFVIAAN